MDKKIKLITVASVVAVMVSGCSGYRGSSQGINNDGGFNNSASVEGSTSGGGSQVARTGQVYGQRRPATCTPCAAAAKPKSTYTYTPAPKKQYTRPAARPAPRQAGQHSQQYYIDRWNRQQQAQQNRPATNTYNGYGSGNYKANADAGNTTYYDYSSAGQSATNNTTANVSASNKSIYTGSYQQKTYKPYQPTTYAGGSAATTNTNTTYAGGGTTSSGGSGNTYTVRKGDTVFEIMRQTGVYWKDIIRINGLQAPAYNINPGQIIRLK